MQYNIVETQLFVQSIVETFLWLGVIGVAGTMLYVIKRGRG